MTAKEPTNPWLDSDVELLRKLSADNASNDEISQRLGRSISSVKAKISRLNLPARMRTQKAWPPEEMAQLLLLRDKMRLGWTEIGKRLNRPGSTCYMRYYDYHRAPPKSRVMRAPPSEAAGIECQREWRHRQSLSPISLTAAILGDPLPGYSALDRRSA